MDDGKARVRGDSRGDPESDPVFTVPTAGSPFRPGAGGDDPYDRLKRTLKAEINAEAWETLYRTESRPFPTPVSGRIAVKVINDYGDEVMKVFDLA